MNLGFKKSLLLVLLCVSSGGAFCDSVEAIVADSAENAKAKFKRFEALAAENNAKAQEQLGNMYRKGKGVTKDLKKSFEYYEKAAQQGLVTARLAVANAYYEGEGVVQDYKKAFESYKEAALANCAEAQSRLGEMYRDGLGVVEKNAKEAAFWLQKASDQGFYLAKRALAELERVVDSLKS